MRTQLDIHEAHFNKHGEELCGDRVRIRQTPDRTIVVLSDGLGSGVKANILSTMTAEIIVTMLAARAPMEEVVRTVIGTLPVCKVRELAYATFTAVTIDNASGAFSVANFDNPRIVWLKHRRLQVPDRLMQDVLGRQIAIFDGRLEEGDFVGLLSDGILHAGLGTTMNLGWGWENLAKYVEESACRWSGTPRGVVQRVMKKVWNLYQGKIGDDATFVGIGARQRRSAIVFTGPPLTRDDDARVVKRLLEYPGRKIVCGGTTGNIVARYLDEEPEVQLGSMTAGVPPIAKLREVDLMTEGIITMSKALELLRMADKDDEIPAGIDGAAALARELMLPDEIHFVVGQTLNDFYQNPSLPVNISLRRSLVHELIEVLRESGKDVTVEYC